VGSSADEPAPPMLVPVMTGDEDGRALQQQQQLQQRLHVHGSHSGARKRRASNDSHDVYYTCFYS